jgi:Phytanoyl-CoA dioxygenase (PhyH)
MGTIFIDSKHTDDERRQLLYAGDLFVRSPRTGSAGICELARELCEAAFTPHDPPTAQDHMPAEQYAAILADLKPKFIHHDRAKTLICTLLDEAGCDTEKTYFDVPRLRTMAHGEYMNAGLALQFHPHRDTWFSAPYQQLNWWLPVYDIEAENSMAFHPRYFNTPIENSSSGYDYDEWNRTGRQQAAQLITKDTRVQPKPEEELELEPDVRVVTPVGGVLVFSAAQLHSTVPNTTERTRFSIDFRTVNIDDLRAGVAAPNVDSECTGTTLGDFVRASDLEPLPADLVDRYRDGARATMSSSF